MREFLEALRILLIGMGVVFLSLIILMALMELLGRFLKDKVASEPPLEPESEPLPVVQANPSGSDSAIETSAGVEATVKMVEALARVPEVATAPPQASVPAPEAPATSKAVKPGASMDRKRKAAIAGVMAFLSQRDHGQEEAAALSRKGPLPRVSPDVIGIVSSWKIAGRQLLMGSRGRPFGGRRG